MMYVWTIQNTIMSYSCVTILSKFRRDTIELAIEGSSNQVESEDEFSGDDESEGES